MSLTGTLPSVIATAAQGESSSVEIPGGLTDQARVLVAVLGLGAVAFILVLLRRRQLGGRYALLWTAVALALGVLGLFPGLLTWVSEQLGIYYPPALFLLVTTGFLFAVVVQFSWELTRLEERTRTLAEELALVRAESSAEPPAPAAPPEQAEQPDESDSSAT